jgi:hypothetical protein
VTERRENSWRAGYVIVPVAMVVGLLQILIPSASERWSWPHGQRQPAPAETAGSDVGDAIPAPAAERQLPAPPENIDPSAAGTGPSAEGSDQALPDYEVVARIAEPAEERAAAASNPARIFIHHAAGAGNALSAIRLAAYLDERGFDVTDIRSVNARIERPSVRYFFGSDQPAGRRLVEAMGAFFADAPGQAPDEATDFSHFAPKPRRGNIEVWLPEPHSDELS